MSNFIYEHEGKQYSPDGEIKPILDKDGHNIKLEKSILDDWAKKPLRATVYVQENLVTTWLGTKMGTIIYRNTYKNNLGKVITTIRIRGTNDAVYWGRYGSDWSQLCWVRKVKNQRG